MWQSRLSFAVGLLLLVRSPLPVAEIANGSARQASAKVMSVSEFLALSREKTYHSEADAGESEAVSADNHREGIVGLDERVERRPVRSISLVEFAKEARSQAPVGDRLRISLVELMGDSSRHGSTPSETATQGLESGFTREPFGSKSAQLGDSAKSYSQRSEQETAKGGDRRSAHVIRRGVEPQSVRGATRGDELQTVPDLASSQESPVKSKAESHENLSTQRTQDVLDQVEEQSITVVDVGNTSEPGRAELLPSGSSASFGDEPVLSPPSERKLSLFDAVRYALNAHPRIVESLSRLEQQQELVGVARAGYWPRLRSGVNTGYRHSTGRSEEAFTVSASQMLYDFGKVSSAVDAAELGVEREKAGVLLAAEDLIRETAQAFIEARRYEVLLGIASEQIEAIADLEALAAKRSALGASTKSDEIQARSRLEAARATQLQIRAQRDQWYRALENLIGTSHVVALDETYPEAMEAVCVRLPETFDNAPRVAMAEAERAEAAAIMEQARAELRPTLSLNADFEHYLNRESERLQQLDDQEFVVSLNLTSNLFEGGALRARRRAADHALRSATAARDTALLELSRLYRETRDRTRSLASTLVLQDERHASIVKTQELYRHQYLSLGTRTLLDILNTEQEIFQTRVDKQNTLFDLRRLQIDCLYSVGGLREMFRIGDALSRRAELRP